MYNFKSFSRTTIDEHCFSNICFKILQDTFVWCDLIYACLAICSNIVTKYIHNERASLAEKLYLLLIIPGLNILHTVALEGPHHAGYSSGAGVCCGDNEQ